MAKNVKFSYHQLEDFISLVRTGPIKLSIVKHHFNLSESELKGFIFFLDSNLKGVWEDICYINGFKFDFIGITDWGLYEYDRNTERCDREDTINRRTAGGPLLRFN